MNKGWFLAHPIYVTKQYNLVPAKGRLCSATGKVTVGLVLQWPCVTDFSALSTYGLTAKVRKMSTPPTYIRAWSYLFTYICILSKRFDVVNVDCRFDSVSHADSNKGKEMITVIVECDKSIQTALSHV